MTDQPVGARAQVSALAIVLLYLTFGTAYAFRVPIWQAPDEPAHVNYVLHIARGNGIPVLEAGAYDRAYLERLTGGRFREGLPVDRVTYEAHQPPLYYLLLAPVGRLYEAAGPEATVRALRLSSLALGVVLLALTWGAGRVLLPNDPMLPIGAMAFVALLPQHLAMLAAVNNDVLAEITVAGVLLASLLILQGRFSVVTGALVGAALLTKTTAYAAALLPLLATLLSLRGAGAWLWRGGQFTLSPSKGGNPAGGPGVDAAPNASPPHQIATAQLRQPAANMATPPPCEMLQSAPVTPPLRLLLQHDQTDRLTRLLAVYGVAVALGAAWWLRNASVYGGADILGLVRHAEIVSGQPQVDVWTAVRLRTALVTTFQSFWLQLGWMAAPAEAWLYQALAAVCGCVAAGVAAAIKRHWSGGLALCLGLVLLVALQTAVYNLQFYQPQGRYLFPALVPIAVLTVLGLRELAGPRLYPAALGTMVLGLVGLNVYAHLVVVPTL